MIIEELLVINKLIREFGSLNLLDGELRVEFFFNKSKENNGFTIYLVDRPEYEEYIEQFMGSPWLSKYSVDSYRQIKFIWIQKNDNKNYDRKSNTLLFMWFIGVISSAFDTIDSVKEYVEKAVKQIQEVG